MQPPGVSGDGMDVNIDDSEPGSGEDANAEKWHTITTQGDSSRTLNPWSHAIRFPNGKLKSQCLSERKQIQFSR